MDAQEIAEMLKGLEHLREGNKKSIETAQLEAYKAVNNADYSLGKYFFAIAAVLVPIIFSVTSSADARSLLDQNGSLLILSTLILLFVSLISGLAHMLLERYFFRDWLNSERRKLEIWSQDTFWPIPTTNDMLTSAMLTYEKLRDKSNAISNNMKNESGVVFLVIQGVTLLMAVVSLFIVIIRTLP